MDRSNDTTHGQDSPDEPTKAARLEEDIEDLDVTEDVQDAVVGGALKRTGTGGPDLKRPGTGGPDDW
jgi:hypothetical protein